MSEETAKAKIIVDGKLWHRVGDLGYIDQEHRLWFLGRKTHKVFDGKKTHYSIRVEAIFNQHKDVKRTALIQVANQPALAVERLDGKTELSREFEKELKALAASNPHTEMIRDFYLHPAFPVDVRHNIKIDRVKLSQWAQKK